MPITHAKVSPGGGMVQGADWNDPHVGGSLTVTDGGAVTIPDVTTITAPGATAGGAGEAVLGTPTLAQVLVAGNDPGGTSIVATASIVLSATDPDTGLGSLANIGDGLFQFGFYADGGDTPLSVIRGDVAGISVFSAGSSGSAAQALTAQGDGTALWADLPKAAFVEPTTATPEAICLALIAAGLMEPS